MTSRFSSECSGGSQREKKEGEVKGPRSPAHLSSPARPMALDSAGVSVRAMTAKWETEIRNIQRGRQKRTGKSGRRSGAAGSATGLWEERHTLARLKDKLETRDGRLLLRLENEEWQALPGCLARLSHVQEWHIRRTGLRQIPAFLSGFQNLLVMDLSRNALGEIPPQIGGPHRRGTGLH
ncbi:leucine-rich repeat-containing protein 39 isoform X2 [Stigmatopora argus]